MLTGFLKVLKIKLGSVVQVGNHKKPDWVEFRI